MQYYRISVDTITKWEIGTYWFEINEAGHAERQIVHFSNGNSLSYDRMHPQDEYDGLQEMVVDGDEKWWEEYAISKEEFEHEWVSRNRMNRSTGFEKKRKVLWSESSEEIMSEKDIPF